MQTTLVNVVKSFYLLCMCIATTKLHLNCADLQKHINLQQAISNQSVLINMSVDGSVLAVFLSARTRVTSVCKVEIKADTATIFTFFRWCLIMFNVLRCYQEPQKLWELLFLFCLSSWIIPDYQKGNRNTVLPKMGWTWKEQFFNPECWN